MLMPLLLALPWMVLPVLLLLIARRRPVLEDWPPLRGRPAPLVSVIVPARNEERTIERCVRSVLRSEYPALEAIVVDDGSTDATAAIVAALAREDPRLRLVAAPPLPAGWFGKPWACSVGARAARGEYLLFTDADVVHEPELIGRSLRALRDERAAMVTVLPRQILLSVWERLIMPQVLMLILHRYPDPARVNASRRALDKIANGQFILVRRDAYEALGGHAAVRHEVAEDLRLAQHFHRSGHEVRLIVADRFMAVRMYDSLRGIVEGWSKNVAIASRQTVPPLVRPFTPWLLVVWLAGLWVAPPAVLALAAAGMLGTPWLLWSLLVCTLSLAFWLGVLRRMRVPLRYVFLYPLGAALAAAIVLKSALQGHRVTWKGRAYRAPGVRVEPG